MTRPLQHRRPGGATLQHRYLVKAGRWKAEGWLQGAGQEPQAVSGESIIRHDAESWSIEVNLGTFTNSYRIQPLPRGGTSTVWIGDNPDLGRFIGRVALVERCILSSFRSEFGAYEGSECLWLQDGGVYEWRGCLFQGPVCVSRWAITLTRLRVRRKRRSKA